MPGFGATGVAARDTALTRREAKFPAGPAVSSGCLPGSSLIADNLKLKIDFAGTE